MKRPRGGLLRFQDEYTIVGTYTLTELSLAETEEVPGCNLMYVMRSACTTLCNTGCNHI